MLREHPMQFLQFLPPVHIMSKQATLLNVSKISQVLIDIIEIKSAKVVDRDLNGFHLLLAFN